MLLAIECLVGHIQSLSKVVCQMYLLFDAFEVRFSWGVNSMATRRSLFFQLLYSGLLSSLIFFQQTWARGDIKSTTRCDLNRVWSFGIWANVVLYHPNSRFSPHVVTGFIAYVCSSKFRLFWHALMECISANYSSRTHTTAPVIMFPFRWKAFLNCSLRTPRFAICFVVFSSIWSWNSGMDFILCSTMSLSRFLRKPLWNFVCLESLCFPSQCWELSFLKVGSVKNVVLTLRVNTLRCVLQEIPGIMFVLYFYVSTLTVL